MKNEGSITHHELCRKTLEWAVNKFRINVGVYEYQSYSTGEFPDVLAFKDSLSYLFEIKLSKSDFLADAKKTCRQKWKTRVSWWVDKNMLIKVSKNRPELFYVEKPHMGVYRYYVCPWGLITPEEVGAWGLYWYRDGRFFKKKESEKFRRNLLEENSLLVHAMRKVSNLGLQDNIFIKKY